MAVVGKFGFNGNVNNFVSGLTYKGTWDALLNSPFLTSSVGVGGEYYIVNVAGTTNLNGVTDWQVGDWAIFIDGSTNVWQKVDNHDVQAYSFVQEEGVNLPQQNTIDFQGAGVTASNGVGKTVVTIPIQPAYATVQNEGVSLPQQPILDFQGDGVDVTNGAGKTIVTIPSVPPSVSYGLFAQTSNSLSASGVIEQSIIGSGVGTLTVPANGFSIGDSFQASLDGILSCVGSATLHIHVKTLSGIILADTGIIAMDTATSKSWLLTLYFTIRNIGGTTVASISSGGLFSYIRNSGTQFEGYVLSTINNTTFDTTIANTLVITAQWNTNNATNQIQSRNFTLIKIY